MDSEATRPSFESLMMDTARLWSQRGTCSRLQVGAVLARDNRIISIGYNGAPSGNVHCLHVNDDPCAVSVHAEENVIQFAARHGLRVEGATMFITHAPCYVCARGMVNAGVAEVCYGEEYRDTRGLDLLRFSGVSLKKR